MALPTTTTTIKKVALPSLPVPPRITLSVKKQEALTHETVIENGAEKDMQIMLKGKPYKFVLGLEDIQTGEPSSLDFTGITVKAHLHYDSPDNDRVKRREVQQMKTKTIDAVGQLSSNKKEYMLEVKIHTLSTQHEDQRFRVRFRAMEAATMQCIAGVESADSLPIRVISKPDVLRPRNTPKPKKRTFPEMMLEQMSELNRANRLLQEKVDLLLKTQASQPLLQHEQQQQQTLATTTTTTTTSSTSQAGLLNKVVKAEEDEEDFEALVRKAMSTYARMATEERASKLRKLVSSSSVSEEQTLSEFAHQLQQECQCDEQTKLANFQFSSDDLADFDKLSTTLCNTFEFADLGFEPSDMHFMNTCS